MKKYLTLFLLTCLISLSYGQNNIIKYEYWFDGDYSNKSTITVSPTNKLDVNSQVSTSGLIDGIHTYNVRFMDDAYLWSNTTSQFFYKRPDISTFDYKISEYEHWFDGDYANRTTSVVAPTDNLDVNSQISTTGLTDGIHTYNVRFKDNLGDWSSSLSQFFYKTPTQTTNNNKVVAYRYWLNDDFEQKTNVTLSTPSVLFNLDSNLTLTQLPVGQNSISFQFLDNNGLWSVISTSIFDKTLTINIINNTFNQNLLVYPNPTYGKVFIDFKEMIVDINITIHDISGKLIQKSDFHNQRILEFDFNERPGIYFMTISSENKKTTLKLTKH